MIFFYLFVFAARVVNSLFCFNNYEVFVSIELHLSLHSLTLAIAAKTVQANPNRNNKKRDIDACHVHIYKYSNEILWTIFHDESLFRFFETAEIVLFCISSKFITIIIIILSSKFITIIILYYYYYCFAYSLKKKPLFFKLSKKSTEKLVFFRSFKIIILLRLSIIIIGLEFKITL